MNRLPAVSLFRFHGFVFSFSTDTSGRRRCCFSPPLSEVPPGKTVSPEGGGHSFASTSRMPSARRGNGVERPGREARSGGGDPSDETKSGVRVAPQGLAKRSGRGAGGWVAGSF